MRIKTVNDIHLEFSDITIKNDQNCDVLILSGDTMTAEDLHRHPDSDALRQAQILDSLGSGQQAALRFRDFLLRCSDSFAHVIYVAGNHEFYQGRWNASIEHLREECARFSNVYFLERDTKIIDDVVFVGGTLWTDMNKHDPLTLHTVRELMNDFRLIRNDDKGFTALKPADTVARHKQTMDYIKHVVQENANRKCVVVGHHAPSHQSIHPMYSDDHLMNGAYCSDLSEFILDHPQIVLWTHGHTHHYFDYKIGDTRVVCNPRGYDGINYSEYTGWDPDLVIEI
jgi:Icc-related predicted phosphoesterase